MLMKEVLVSIGISVFNEADTLEAALCSMLNQSYEQWEMIIIDDGSSDATSDIIVGFEDPRIVHISDGHNRGLPARLNQAVTIAKGKYFARMDADDLSFPERLAKQVAYLEAHPEVDLLGTGALVIDDKNALIGKFRVAQTHEDICARPWDGISLPHPTWMGKTDWFKAHPYDTSMRRAQDQLLLVSAYPDSRYACLAENLLAYRVDRPSLISALRKRGYYAAALFKLATARGCWLIGCAAAAKQGGKVMVELVLRLLSATRILDRKRFAMVDQNDHERWNTLRTSLDINCITPER
jgi:glycosyltransferase involved in cell wall biosynthesis